MSILRVAHIHISKIPRCQPIEIRYVAFEHFDRSRIMSYSVVDLTAQSRNLIRLDFALIVVVLIDKL